MKKSSLLAIFLTLMMFTAAIYVNNSQAITELVAPTVVDKALAPTSTFSIDINVVNVVDLWGFQFVFDFDPNVITATSFTVNPIFTDPSPSEIGADYVAIAYSMAFGVPDGGGFNGNTTLATVNFDVVAEGMSLFDFRDDPLYASILTDPVGNNIAHVVVDGSVTTFVAPTAAFTFSPSSPIIGQSVTFDASTSDPGSGVGTINQYAWNFSDGTSVVTEPDPTTTHSFTTEGTYSVNLTVTDDEGKSNSVLHDVVVTPVVPLAPIASFTYSPTEQLANQTVTFNATASTDPDGTIASYGWNFGDGTAPVTETDPIIDHVFKKNGTYTVTLTVTDNDAMTDTETKSVSVLVKLAVFPTTTKAKVGSTFYINITIAGVKGLWGYEFVLKYNTTVLTATSYQSYAPFTQAWPSKINDTAGTVDMAFSMRSGESVGFTATVPEPMARIDFIVDAAGSSALDLQNTKLAAVLPPPGVSHKAYDGTLLALIGPTASFTNSPTQPVKGQTVNFDAAGSTDPDGTITSYEWDFDDGTSIVTEADATTTHVFNSAGDFNVTLEVTDSNGFTSSVTHEITVLKVTSTINIAASPATVEKGKVVTISGSITPSIATATVTMSLRSAGTQNWTTLSTVQTGTNGQYTYAYTTPSAGSFEVKASWAGDQNTSGAESSVASFQVQEPPVDNTYLYIIVGIVVVAAVAIAIYLWKFRK